ncbi:N-acylneuraminate cytidylyltransferase [Aeromicrobium panaciterrae]|uniref:acylneuraminate cytidylyltransferase n=1 Tax=Aeromicrobium panaciterrae TaxID=363861 RepID=UPI0031D5E6A1
MSQDLMNPQSELVELGGVCAVIPARGGSKGVPRKNLRLVGGESLIARAVRAVAGVSTVDAVYVSTDDAEIADAARNAGARVIDRPTDIAGDTASSEAALQHALGKLEAVPEVTVFVQATSPFIDREALEGAIDLVRADECDVAFSVTRSDVHLWRAGVNGPEGVNHDASGRLRRQDRAPEYAETGAFYVMRTTGFLEHGHRFFGRVEMVEVDPVGALEIDTEHDLRLARLLAAATDAPIGARAVVTDFDGVHTDDRVTVDEFGIESVTVSRSDGMGIARLRRAGIPVLILSTERNPVVTARGTKLGVEVIAACDDKRAALARWAAGRQIDLGDIAYLGNDVNDVACLNSVGWPVVVADAHHEARAASRIVLRRNGGEGAVRELADRVLDSIAPTKGHDHG